MKFLHISDTHFLVNNKADIYGLDYNPNDILKDFLIKHDFSDYDFIVHTGDLISDGNHSDYDALFELMDQYLPDNLQVHYVLGNHDRRQDFCKANKLDLNTEGYYYTKNYDGYRLIFLDTLNEGQHGGHLDQKQLDWLYNELKTPTEKGTLLFMHHPIEIGWYSNESEFDVPQEFKERLKNSDVLAIFTGHIHMQRTSIIDGIQQFTANSMAFGISLRKDTYWRNNRLGYSYAVIDKKHIDYNHEIIFPKTTDFKEEERETFENL